MLERIIYLGIYCMNKDFNSIIIECTLNGGVYF